MSSTFYRPVATLLIACASCFASEAQAEVRPHALIGNGMVIQRDRPIQLRGTAAKSEKVSVEFGEQAATTTVADDDGRWEIELLAQPAGGPHRLTLRGENSLTFDDVYVGDVWICSGQSNMGWPVATRPGSAELLGSENPKIRLFTVPQRMLDEPAADLPEAASGSWSACGPTSLVNFSAVAYYFGRELTATQNVPIGLIHASYGGSPVDQWLAGDAPAALKKPEAAPQRPGGRTVAAKTSRLYNGMIAPLVRFPIRGVIWYQGEADVGRPEEYEAKFSALIRNWRNDWHQETLPFLFVQIAPYGMIQAGPQASSSAALREAQLKTSRAIEQTGMAVVTDWGHETDIHVKQKKPVGRRLALLARALVYGEKDLEYSGPALRRFEVKGNEAVLTFDHVGSGLVAKRMVREDFSTDPRTGNGGALHVVDASANSAPIAVAGFTIAGTAGKFVDAQAELRGNQIIVTSPEVADPKAVRYGWANYPTGNLFNGAGLPASPFRTDDWKLEPPSAANARVGSR